VSEPTLALRALRHRNFRLFIAGLGISLIGTWIQSIAQSWLIYRLTHSEWYLGVVTFCAHAPVLLLSPIAGLAADRLPRHRIVLLTQSLFLLQASALAWLTLTDRVAASHVLILAALLGCANAFDIPARQSLMVQLTSKEDLLGAISLNSVAFNTARTLGPSIGGLLVARFGEGVCFAVNAVSFVAVLGSLLLIRIPRIAAAPGPAGGGIGEGLRYAWRETPIRNALLLCGAMTLTNAPPLVLGPAIAEGLFHRGAAGLGVLMASFGLGATAGVVQLSSQKHSRGMRDVAGRGAALYAFSLGLYAAAPAFWIVVGAAFLGGYAFFRQNAANNALIQSIVEERYRGRVMSLYTMMAVGVLPMGGLLAGAGAELGGPRIVLGVSCACAVCAAAAFLRYTRSIDVSPCNAS